MPTRKASLVHKFGGLNGTPRFSGKVSLGYSRKVYTADKKSAAGMHPEVRHKYMQAVEDEWQAFNSQKNPGQLLKSGEWTPAHAVRIRKGKLEILR